MIPDDADCCAAASRGSTTARTIRAAMRARIGAGLLAGEGTRIDGRGMEVHGKRRASKEYRAAQCWPSGIAMNGRSFSLRSSTSRCARRCVPLRIVKWTRDVGFSTIDYLTLIAYLAGITLFGMRFRRAQRTVRDYFIGARTTSWVVISLSIVATETSTLTLIGVPALVYSDFARPEQGGSLTYLQIVLGYVIARFVISVLFIPAYFQGELLTAYELLHRRFGARTKNF